MNLFIGVLGYNYELYGNGPNVALGFNQTRKNRPNRKQIIANFGDDKHPVTHTIHSTGKIEGLSMSNLGSQRNDD